MAELIPAGDKLQSEASRMAGWIQSLPATTVPYEVLMSSLEAVSAVEAWTAARRG